MSVDLSSFLSKIKDKQDRVFFNEAVICGINDANNACFLMLWMSLIRSLKRRFIEIGKSDTEVSRIVKKCNDIESNHRAVDNYLIDQGKEYGFYDDVTHNDLLYLYKKRSLIIHPYMSNVSEADIIHASTIIVDKILSNPIKLRHSYCKILIHNLLEPHYIEDSRDAVISFLKDVRKRIDPSVMPWLINDYLSKLDLVYNDRTLVNRKQMLNRGIYIISYILSSSPRLFKKDEYHSLIMKYPRLLSLILGKPELFVQMNSKTKHSIIQYLLDTYTENLGNLRVVERLIDEQVLSEKYIQQFHRIIQLMDFDMLIDTRLSIHTMLVKLHIMLRARDYETNNLAIEYINDNMPDMMNLDFESLFQIGKRIVYLAKKKCYKAQAFLKDIIVYSLPVGFLTGLLYANFITDKDSFVMKYDYLEVTADLLEKCTQQGDVLDCFFKEIDKLTHLSHANHNDRIKIIESKIKYTSLKESLIEYFSSTK